MYVHETPPEEEFIMNGLNPSLSLMFIYFTNAENPE
jgi:hypothetical protein